MNGLRIYVKTTGTETRSGDPVFYSRRSNGPYYRWCYEEKLAKWRACRIVISDFSHKELGVATWKGVPAALKDKLTEHYQE